MNKEKIGIPKLRFPGFTGAWEQRKLGDYLSIPTKEPITNINELKLMTLKLNLEGITLTANRETLKLGATKYYKRHEGQLLYGKQNFFHGSIALIPKEAEGYATSGDVPALNISNINNKYLVDYISRPIYFEAKEALATGTGSKRIHEKTLFNFKIAVPSSEEQSEISNFIAKYTNLIALHQRKLEHLKQQKNGLLQKMFPKSGESVPEVRFPGFTDSWEQRRLGEVADSVEYGINAPAKEYDGINKYLRITDIDDTTHEFLQSDLTSPDTDLTLAEKFKLLEGDILFARTGASVGKSYIYSREDGSVYYAGFLIRMRFNKSISPNFIFQNTLTTAYKQYVEVTSQRSGQPGVNAKEYSNYSLYIPSKEEQQKIGSFFQQLDTLIALYQRKLEHLELLKKGLLQQMFV
ncbi:restriction endonuclease subunit S [Ligilactobacillus agilis]|uniref:restriction endonuclease subunit S n=1 Tax=Ligilactobacillus agilis TaxID=1601 RepID=UPI001DEAD541|nr:restriction endonuclease subunit S [Ligilactobacillus agilis]HJG06359.1 restriction endonuclease subunit S [Ligilactobacillus agilis]